MRELGEALELLQGPSQRFAVEYGKSIDRRLVARDHAKGTSSSQVVVGQVLSSYEYLLHRKAGLDTTVQ